MLYKYAYNIYKFNILKFPMKLTEFLFHYIESTCLI